jgi:hypothetical protein
MRSFLIYVHRQRNYALSYKVIRPASGRRYANVYMRLLKNIIEAWSHIANILPQPFLSTHRRIRSQTQSQNKNSALPAPAPAAVPEHLRTPDRRTKLTSISSLNTPPPKSTVLDKIKLQGTMTEPAQPRRRAPYGPVRPNAQYIYGSTLTIYIPGSRTAL